MMKKKYFVGLTVLLSATLLAACGNGGSSSGGNDVSKGEKAMASTPEPRFTPDPDVPSWQSDTDTPAKLKWYVNFDWYARSDWGLDVVSRKIKEDMNIDVEFVNGNDEKMNTMLAGEDLPDLMTFDRNLSAAEEAAKFTLPLNLLAEKYDPYFLEHAAKPETLKWYTLEDGNVYGYPSFSTTTADYETGGVQGDQVFIVRKDIYEAIGSPDMSTPEGFINALKKAKEVQPKVDDGSDLVPFGLTALDIANGADGALSWVLQDFLNIPLMVDDKANDRDSNPDYIAWLEVFRKAYNDELISNDQFSDNDNIMKEKLAQGKYFAYLHSNTKGINEVMSENNTRNDGKEMYIAVDGPKNSKGEDPTFSGGNIGGWTQTFITTSTKEPQKAMELITYLTSEYGTMVSAFGIEGETYNLEDGLAVLTDETEELRNTDIATFDKEVGLGSYWQVANDNFAIEMGQKPATSIRQMVDWAADKLAPRFELEDIDPKTGSLARNLTKVNTERVQAMVNVIQAKSEEEGKAIWDEFLQGRNDNGWEEIVKYRNEKIEQNIERLK